MTTKRVGADWLDTDATFDEFVNPPHAYYSIDGGADVDLGEITTVEMYQETQGDETVDIYRGTFNDTIPAGAVGSNVVLKIYDPVNENDKLEYDAINVCTDVATSAVVSPSSATVRINKTRQFTVVFYAADSLPTDNHDAAVWSTDASGPTEGSIDEDTGLFTGGTEAGGPFTVTVTAGLLEDTANVTVVITNTGNNTVYYSFNGMTMA